MAKHEVLPERRDGVRPGKAFDPLAQTATTDPVAFTASAWRAAISVALVCPATFRARVTIEIIA
jgi:hypothetical protein